MFINKIKITNFKSIYDTQEFDFTQLVGLNKLTGPVGSGKTTLCEAILYGLYGQVKNQKIPALVAWNTREMSVSLELYSNNKLLYISRGNLKQTEFYVDGKQIPAPSKIDIQNIINNYYDVPRTIIERMCLVSFDMSKMSILNMSPAQVKLFIDDVFGFSTFTKYADLSNRYKLDSYADISRVDTKISQTESNIESIRTKMVQQIVLVNNSINEESVKTTISIYNKEIDKISSQITGIKEDANRQMLIYKQKREKIQREYNILFNKKCEVEVEGKQLRKNFDLISSGKCSVCGHEISESELDDINNKINCQKSLWKTVNSEMKQKQAELSDLDDNQNKCKNDAEYNISLHNKKINDLKNKIHEEELKLREYHTAINSVNTNYTDIIDTAKAELERLKTEKATLVSQYENWTELTELLSHTFRYNMMSQIVPRINIAIQSYISQTGLPFSIVFTEEFKPKIYSSYYNKEIPYSSLSTGQKKSVDMATIFGILNCIVSQTGFNIIILDELFSNMDAEIRNTMLSILRANIKERQSIFIINHADMDDSFFDHKIQVSLKRSSVTQKKDTLPVGKSVYTTVF